MSDADGSTTVFEVVGGQPFFDELCDRFYRRVDADAVLRPLYPDDAEGYLASERWLALFLGQYWGGPGTYSEVRGHPRLRMRHAHFPVGQRERNAWYDAMAASVEEVCADLAVDDELRGDLRRRFLDYFAMAADHLRNSPA